jgi:hypothetical protein
MKMKLINYLIVLMIFLFYVKCTPSIAHQKTVNEDFLNQMAISSDTDDKGFCGVPPSMLVQLIKNYKTNVWNKTSNIAADTLDSRFLEISIEELEAFITYAKNSATSDGLNLTSVRLYYINYPGKKKTQTYLAQQANGDVFHDFSGCHSLAFVPVVGTSIDDTARRDYFQKGLLPQPNLNLIHFNNPGDLVYIPSNCKPNSTLANHNYICPPLNNCAQKTLLEVADAL